MDNWRDHLLFHLISYLVFTLPILALVNAFMLHESFVMLIPWTLIGVVPVVLIIGLIKFGLPRRSV